MASHDYHFVTVWRFLATVDEVAAILADGPALPRWWPSVYLDVQELEPGDERGFGKVIVFYTKGWLPYTLRWQLRVDDVRADGFGFEAWGDFVGRGVWQFRQDGPWACVFYDWKIRADKPLLRYLSPLLKPLFSANHRWAMARGEQSLRLELLRRQARTDAERALIPPPPRPTTTSPLPLALAMVVLGGILYLLARRTWHR